MLPQRGECRTTLDVIGADVWAGGGRAYGSSTGEPENIQFPALFDRGEDYSALLAQVTGAANTWLTALKEGK
jgi:hypothetical protein